MYLILTEATYPTANCSRSYVNLISEFVLVRLYVIPPTNCSYPSLPVVQFISFILLKDGTALTFDPATTTTEAAEAEPHV